VIATWAPSNSTFACYVLCAVVPRVKCSSRSAIASDINPISEPKLAEMMIGMLVRPSLPISNGHRAERAVNRLDDMAGAFG
jgi:hypothetical protein